MLPERPLVAAGFAARLEADFERFREGLPPDLRGYCLEAYGLDLAGEYAGLPIANPFGKASGQLSLNPGQVRRDRAAGLGFVVLKTVIAEDERGARSMEAWAVPETRMRVERIRGREGAPGWTVTWHGRGWSGSLDGYCRFFAAALEAGGEMPVAPSVKYHLPGPGEASFRAAEYLHTTARLRETWRSRREGPMPLEKDFSPTLAGDERSREKTRVLEWLRRVPELIRAAAPPGALRLGVKLMNARFDLDFQVRMVRALLDETAAPPDFLVYANRLFDPQREFAGRRGVAYGGPDLGRRNLEALRRIREACAAGAIRRPLPPISGTGDIMTGRAAVAYALLGATSCQMHTLFQMPASEFAARLRSRTGAVLHHLVFHPESGLLAWLAHLSQVCAHPVSWLAVRALGPEAAAEGRG